MGQSALSCVYFEVDATFDSSSKVMPYLDCSMQVSTKKLVEDGICGTSSRRSERVDTAEKRVGGTVSLNPTKVELDFLLPHILGTAEATDVFAVAETLPEIFLLVDKVDSKVQYNACKCGKATFSSSTGQRMKLGMDLIGKTFDDTIASVPNVSIDTGNHLIHHQATLTIGGTAYKCESVTLTVDNKLEAYFDNTLTANNIDATDREVMIEAQIPYSTTCHTLYQALHGSDTAVAASLVYANGTDTLTFTLASCHPIDLTEPTLSGRGRIAWNLKLQAFRVGTTKEIVVTNATA
jgi:hypothetical protein